jgi:type II secretory ATPase GspE/PulE/Tfp pilus assembly ATPase PilB-like protein
MDMGMEPYVIASALVGVVAQRLVRRLCVSCRRQYTPEADTLRALNIADADAAQFVFYRAVGCEECNQRVSRAHRAGKVMRSDKVASHRAAAAGRGPRAAVAAG